LINLIAIQNAKFVPIFFWQYLMYFFNHYFDFVTGAGRILFIGEKRGLILWEISNNWPKRNGSGRL